MSSLYANMMKELPRSDWEYGSQYDALDEKFAGESEPEIVATQPCSCCHGKKLKIISFKLVVEMEIAS